MPRSLSILCALGITAAAIVVGWMPGAATAAPGAGVTGGTTSETSASSAPLSLTIDELSPAVIPRSGPIRVSGTLTNEDSVAWSTINLYPFVSESPMTAQAELTAAVRTDPETLVGRRIGDPIGAEIAPSDVIETLPPGRSTRFSLQVPSRYLNASEPGVYWFGVHALGESEKQPRDGVADGRARTFLAQLHDAGQPNRTVKPLPTALVLPVRERIAHATDGSLTRISRWRKSLEEGGRLDRIVDFGAAAGHRPLTWLVDPAVPDAVERLIAGNPARSIGPTVDGGPGGESPSDPEDPDDSGDPADADSPGNAADSEGGSAGGPSLDSLSGSAQAWMDRWGAAMTGQQILALPYGDLDVSAAAQDHTELIQQAISRSGTEIGPWQLPTTPALHSPTGYLDPEIRALPTESRTVLITDRMIDDHRVDLSPAVIGVDGERWLVGSTSAVAGGPGPDERTASVALRQRFLGEAALRVLSPQQEPLLAVMPASTLPDDPDTFFAGLDQEWLDLVDVTELSSGAATEIDAERLRYPDSQAELELAQANLSSAESLASAGQSLQSVLTLNDRVAATVRDQALTTVSFSWRDQSASAQISAEATRSKLRDVLGRISVEGRSVILSSANGRFAANVTNGLDEPVTVLVEPRTDGTLEVSAPDAVEVPANSRTQVLLNARSTQSGVHRVRLVLTDPDGAPLGASVDVPIRSADVSNVIWLIMGFGVALLFLAILVRLVRRLRGRDRADRPGPDEAGAAGHDETAGVVPDGAGSPDLEEKR